MPQKATAEYNLQVINPTIAKEWHPTKNGRLAPTDVTPYTSMKAWWICKQAHVWRARIGHRAKGVGCPYCSGLKICEDNCLKTLNPALAGEWHPTKDGRLTPTNVSPNSHKKAWWICKREHEWEAQIKSRNIGRGCPYCHSQTSQIELRVYSELKYIFENVEHRKNVLGVECDIYVTDLKLGIEIDSLYWHKERYIQDKKKTDFLRGTEISLLRVREQGLKRLSSDDIFFSEKSDEFGLLKDILNQIVRLTHITKQQKSRVTEYLKREAISNNDEYVRILEMLPSPLPGFSLWERNRSLSKEWHSIKNSSLSPKDVTPNSHKIVWWVCDRGHEWRAYVSNRNKGRGCPYCSGQKVCEDNCLQTLNPLLSAEWHPTKNGTLTPSDVTPSTHKRVWWVCDKGHEWQAQVADRNRGTGCPYCAGKLVCDDNCLQTLNPSLAAEWHPSKNDDLTPRDVTSGSARKAWWACKSGHEWEASISNRNTGQGCPYCAGKAVCDDNCLQTLNPSLAAEWHPSKNDSLTPRDVTIGTHKKVWWVCASDHEWKASIVHRAKGVGCPYCAGKAVCDDNCLQTLNPVLAAQWHPGKNGRLTPRDVRPNSHKKVWWLCAKRHEWQAQIASRNRGNNCPYCSGRKKS